MRQKAAIVLAMAGVLCVLGDVHLGLAQGQRTEVRSRILLPIDDEQRVVLTGNTHRLAQARFDLGAAPDDLQLDHLLLVLKRTPEQQAELDTLLQAQQTLGSADYHQWLTPEEFGERFGPSPDDISQITAWLEAHGFRVDEVPAGRGAIDFSGTAGQVREVFHTPLHKFMVRGHEHWANASDPEIPAALAEVVAGVANLDSFFTQPQSVRSSQPFPIPAGKSPEPGYSQGWHNNALAPQDFAVIYNVDPLYRAGTNGSGATIAVVGRTNINVQDVADFRRLFGLPTNPPQVVVNGPDPGNLGGGEELEAVLDNSWAGAAAPNATIKFVATKSTSTADGALLSEQYIINHNLADVMTESFSSCEAWASQSYATTLSALAQQAAAEGISYFVSSGDSGASGCDSGSEISATGPLSVNVLGSSPFITTVGGTQFNEGVGNGPYWEGSNVSASYLSALSYIPEKVWNISCSVAQCGSSANLWAAGGGASQYFQKPSWQTGIAGMPKDGWREVPDVAMAASGEHDPYLLCIDGSCGQSKSTPSFTGVGGTSAATAAFAGIMALVRQNTGARQGQANLVLYQLAAAEQRSGCNSYGPASGACVFHDVTAGSNSVPGGRGFGTDNASYQAGVGYDLATGLGSVNAANLVNQWGPVATPRAALQPSSLVFGSQTVGTSAAKTVTLTNWGTGTLNIASIGFIETKAHQFAQTSTCGVSLKAGASCTISVTFAPTDALSPSASLTVTDNAPGSPHLVPLTGTGTGPAISLGPASLAFGSQSVGTMSSARAVTLTNSGSAALSITSIGFTGTYPRQFAQTNACGTSLSSGASCIISVTYVPSCAFSVSAALTITDNASGSPHSVSLTGTGVALPAVSLSPSSVAFGNQAVGTISSAHTVTLANTGTATLSITGIRFTGLNPHQFAQTNTCGATLNAGASCTISVTFAPTGAFSPSALLTVTDNAAGSPHLVPLTGTGTGPAVLLSPASIAFGTQGVATTSAAQTVTLTNSGNAALSITSIGLTGAYPHQFAQTNACGASLSVGASCTIFVTYTPNSAFLASASLTVTDSAPGSPHSVSLTGTGADLPAVGLSPSSVAFGNQAVGTISSAHTVTLTNTGTATLSITGIGFTGLNPHQFAQTNACGASLSAAASCNISVTYTPTSAFSASASLTITDNAPGSPHSVSLTGTGAALPAVSLSPSSVAFGNQAVGTTSSAQTVTLTNTGTATLSITGIGFTGLNPHQFAQTNTCGASLNAGASCSISVTFAPTSAFSASASLTITDNAAGSPHSVPLTGTGTGTSTGPVVSLSTASIAFGNQTVGTTSSAQTVTLTNIGNATLSIASIGLTGANPQQFAQTGNCGVSLSAGANCTISVTFAPAAASSASASLTVTDSAPGSPHSVSLTGTGTAPPVSLSPASVAFGTQQVGTTSSVQTVTVTNTSNGTLGITGINFTGANSNQFSQNNNCGTSLNAGASCTINVTFAPTATLSDSAMLMVWWTTQ